MSRDTLVTFSHNARVRRRVPQPIAELLGPVLGQVSSRTTAGRPLQPIWEAVVGPLAARHTQVISLEGGVLRVRVEAAAWGVELEKQRAQLLVQLAERLGRGVVTSLEVEPA